jgi:hypothetical protein
VKVLTDKGSYDLDLSAEQLELVRSGPVKGQPLRGKQYRGLLELAEQFEPDTWCTVDATACSPGAFLPGKSDVVSFAVGRHGLYRERRGGRNFCIDVGNTMNQTTGVEEHLVVAGRPDAYNIEERAHVPLRFLPTKEGMHKMRTNYVHVSGQVQPEYKQAFGDLTFRWNALEVRVPNTHTPPESYWQISGVDSSWYREGTESMYALHTVVKHLSQLASRLTGNPVPIMFSVDAENPVEYFSYEPNVPNFKLRISPGISGTVWIEPKDDLGKVVTLLLPEALHRRFPKDDVVYEGLSRIASTFDEEKITPESIKSVVRRFRRARA